MSSIYPFLDLPAMWLMVVEKKTCLHMRGKKNDLSSPGLPLLSLSLLLIFSLIAHSMWRPVCVLTTALCDLCAGSSVINPHHTCT